MADRCAKCLRPTVRPKDSEPEGHCYGTGDADCQLIERLRAENAAAERKIAALTTAGDAMAGLDWNDGSRGAERLIADWRAAKEGR